MLDAPGNDGNASMPEQVKRPNPWRKMMMMMNYIHHYCCKGAAVAQCLRCCATNRKVAVSITDGVIGIFH